MPINEMAKAAAAMHRKLRAIAAVLVDPAATERERANAEALKTRLERQLGGQDRSQGEWRDIVFRLGRTVKDSRFEKVAVTASLAFRALQHRRPP